MRQYAAGDLAGVIEMWRQAPVFIRKAHDPRWEIADPASVAEARIALHDYPAPPILSSRSIRSRCL